MSNNETSVKEGFKGRFYEDFAVGDIYRSRFGRTVTETDNALFTGLTLNTNPLHFDAEYCRNSRWDKILVNSCFTLSLVTGMTVEDVSENAVANLGWQEVKMPNPVFFGDTLYAETQVMATRESKKHTYAGIVTVRSRGINQDGKVVLEFTRNVMVYKRDHSPKREGGGFPTIAE